MQKALSNIRVLDLTHHIAGPYCTKLLAGFGAEVLKIERPRVGDALRTTGPFYSDEADIEQSIPFLWLNTGKKSLTMNLKSVRGVEIFKELAQDADVVIENFSPGVMDRLGIGYQTLSALNPGLVMTSISNFGQTGPYRDYQAEDCELAAMSGGMFLTGRPDRMPLAPGPALCQYTAGQHAHVATLMALFQRASSGEGQYVDVSIHESAIENIEIAVTSNLHAGTIAKRGRHMFVPWDMYECADGYVPVTAMPYRHWRRAAEIFDEPRLFDSKYDRIAERVKHRDEFESLLKPCIKKYKKKELFMAGQERSLAFGYLATLDEALDSSQHRERGFFEQIDHPAVGQHKYCAAPFRMSRTPWQADRAPLLGEHNDEILGGLLGISRQEIAILREKGVL